MIMIIVMRNSGDYANYERGGDNDTSNVRT